MEEKTQAPKNSAKTSTQITLIVATVLFVLSLGPWFICALMTIMFFDAPGSEKLILPYVAALYVWLYPVFGIVAYIASWICYAKDKFRIAFILVFEPLLYIVPFFLMYIFTIGGGVVSKQY